MQAFSYFLLDKRIGDESAMIGHSKVSHLCGMCVSAHTDQKLAGS